MKKVFFSLLVVVAVLFGGKANAQVKVGVFDIDVMVTAMPDYARVDSLVQKYQADSLSTEYQILNSEYHRLDSTWKADSAKGANAAVLKYSADQRQQIGIKLVYWQQYAQQKSQAKTGELAQPLYEQVVNAYKKVLAARKYTIILKPQTYEAGFPIDNLFVSVAKELKLTQLPQELLVLGDDPDAKPAGTGTGAATKPATGTTGAATRPK